MYAVISMRHDIIMMLKGKNPEKRKCTSVTTGGPWKYSFCLISQALQQDTMGNKANLILNALPLHQYNLIIFPVLKSNNNITHLKRIHE